MTAYILAEFEITDQELYLQYRDIARTAIAEFDGGYTMRGAVPEVLEGEWDKGKRFVMLSFADADTARRWYHSETYARALEISPKAMDRRLALLDGTPPAS
jgi:uncharacterized protein (DUF1330 family)